ncbi:hypothetical protein [Burkholderia gladioli]|uniref:hypothetical protein n=1 Tax=Burkholderia gladioli TaxID=28095 RepID=UPI001FC83F5F|nr:hypothetical protein [Burkholderia gladioli]
MTNNTTAALTDEQLSRIEYAIDYMGGSGFAPEADILRALLTSPRAAVPAPEGWKLVPVEPTQAMLDCWWDALPKGTAFQDCTPRGVYGAMLDAAPAAPVADHCQCPACAGGTIHASDCAVHNGPAYPNGPCNCGTAQAVAADGATTDEPIDIALASVDPCPFCGSESVDPKGWAGNDGRTGPACDECGATAETIEGWNRRAAVSPAKDEPCSYDYVRSDRVCTECGEKAATADERAALQWTAGTLQEIVSGRWKGAKESDKVSIGSVTKTVAQVLDMADATLGRASQAAAPADAREPSAWVTPEGDRSITQSQKQGMLRDGGAGASSVQPFSIACYAGAVPADAGEAVAPLSDQDIYDKFSFLEGAVNEFHYRKIADTAIEIARAFQGAQGGKGGDRG